MTGNNEKNVSQKKHKNSEMTRAEMIQELKERYQIEMWSEEKIIAFRKAVLDWFDTHGRDHLPWRESQDPYRIWISEIMLQQTRVITVIPYFNRFMKLFPTIPDLAVAPEEALLKAWEGLGYYSRVRNIQTAAKQILADHDGVFPNKPEEIIKLKGIGPYTAGAISSMAFNIPEPAVDGNVMRVFSRLFEIDEDIAKPATRKLFELLVRIIVDPTRPGDFNQAIMDLGTDICGPVHPRPEESPIKEFNASYLNGTMNQYPFKSKAKKPVPVEVQGLVIQKGEFFLLEKRPSEGLLANFWTFPMVERDLTGVESAEQLRFLVAEDDAQMDEGEKRPLLKDVLSEVVEENYPISPSFIAPNIGTVSHVFSHRKWNISSHHVSLQKDTEKLGLPEHLRWVNQKDFPTYAFAVPQQKMWQAFKKTKLKNS